jgi:putative phage-type endonuclease
MKLLNLEQGSELWLEYRKTRITATDMPIIMRIGYKTPQELLSEKTGIKQPDVPTDCMKRGIELEPIARECFCKDISELHYAGQVVDFNPIVIEHDNGWLMASIDGYCNQHHVAVEIKCGEKSYEKALKQDIPDYYQVQMQVQMEVLDMDEMFYYAFNGETGIVLKVQRKQSVINECLRRGKQFWDLLLHPWDFNMSYEVI